MNFVPSGSSAASASTDRPCPRDGRANRIAHLVLIPSYNSGPRLFDTIAAVRRRARPVWVVVDGSTDGNGGKLAAMALADPGLRVIVLPRNRGKGAAVLHGLHLARADGFTHVLTMDADGQHSADHIHSMIALSCAHPQAMVLGVPVFDASAPRIRIAGHRLANACTGLVTAKAGIGDSLFGMRVYPVAPLLLVFAQTRWMRRFDFDSEAVIRLSWAGVAPVNVVTPVRYFRREDGGVSHFNYLRDNLLLVFMYTRLLGEMLFRLPILLARRIKSFRPRPASPPTPHG